MLVLEREGERNCVSQDSAFGQDPSPYPRMYLIEHKLSGVLGPGPTFHDYLSPLEIMWDIWGGKKSRWTKGEA